MKERDGLRLVACFGSPLPLVRGNGAVGVYNRRSMLALADITAEAERLPKGEPALGREAALDHGAPQDQHVDPRIKTAGCAILRKTERRFRRFCAPRLHPRHRPASSSAMILSVISS
jgi:hypothetical protein